MGAMAQTCLRSFSGISIDESKMKPGEPPLEAIDGVEQFPDHILKLVDEIVKLNLMESNELARCLQIRLGLPDISHLMSAGGVQTNEDDDDAGQKEEEKIIFHVQ